MKKNNLMSILGFIFLELTFIGSLVAIFLDIKHKHEVKSLVKEAEKKKD